MSLGDVLAVLAGGYGLSQSNKGLPQQTQALTNAANQTFAAASDPQNARRDRNQQQLTDAVRAGESARGD